MAQKSFVGGKYRRLDGTTILDDRIDRRRKLDISLLSPKTNEAGQKQRANPNEAGQKHGFEGTSLKHYTFKLPNGGTKTVSGRSPEDAYTQVPRGSELISSESISKRKRK